MSAVAVDVAKAAYKANKDDKSLKAAYKAAKVAHAAAEAAAVAKKAKKSKKSKRKAEAEPEPTPVKKAKTDIGSLTTAVAEAKAAYKANKADASLKVAHKAAKAALAAAQAEAPAAAKEAAPAAGGLFESLKAKKAVSDAAPPAGATDKCFVGNLSWDIDDDSAKDFFKECGDIVDIHWLTDRDSGKFKGCGFLTFDSVEAAVKAVAKTGEMCMGRDIKVDFATPRPDNGKGGKGKGGKGGRKSELSARPDECYTVFCGNLSFEIDDDAMHEFAKDCGTISKIRWLTDRDSGDFKGCGFIEFETTDSVDAFVKLNGQSLLGRDVRLDYAKPRAPRAEW